MKDDTNDVVMHQSVCQTSGRINRYTRSIKFRYYKINKSGVRRLLKHPAQVTVHAFTLLVHAMTHLLFHQSSSSLSLVSRLNSSRSSTSVAEEGLFYRTTITATSQHNILPVC
jgi:hypothetical protein